MKKLLEKIFYSKLFEEIRIEHYRDGYEMGEFEASESLHFKLSDKEEDELKMWQSTHDCFVTGKRGAYVKYTFAPAAGLGMRVEVQCAKCKETKDITDISTW